MHCLDKLGTKFGTDKASTCNDLPPCDYLRHYELFLKQLKNDEFTFIEFGVDKGYSLKMWHEYFPNASIIGVDKNPVSLDADRIVTIQDDVLSDNLFNNLKQYEGNINVIIDDSLHAWSTQRILFEKYFPLLNSKGYYIVEDIRCGAMGDGQYERPKNFIIDRVSFTQYITNMLEILRYPYSYRTEWMQQYSMSTSCSIENLMYSIENISFIPGAIIISKK